MSLILGSRHDVCDCSHQRTKQVYQGWDLPSLHLVCASEGYLWVALEADCGGKREMFAKQLFETKNTPPPTTTLTHAAWVQVAGSEHLLKNNDSVCLWSRDLFLLMKTNIILQYHMRKWGKWEGFEKWNTFVNYLILFVWFPRCYQPLLLEA